MLKHPDPLSGLDLNLLYTFRAFAELGSLRATAQRVGRSQPAVSARLHQLEQELGTPLLVRHGRRLHLTPFGRSLCPRLDDLFAGLQQLVDLARATAEEPHGLLRVGVLGTVGVYRLAPAIARLRARHPNVEIEIAYGLGEANVEGLRAGRLDVALGVGDAPTGDLDVREIGRACAVLAVRAGSLPLPSRALRAKELTSLPWLAFGQLGDAFFDAVWAFMERHRLDERVVVRAAHIQTLKALVSDGTGVCVLPDYTVVEPELETRRVVGLDVSEPIWVATRASSSTIPIVAATVHAITSGLEPQAARRA